jgi:hypothetical protein
MPPRCWPTWPTSPACAPCTGRPTWKTSSSSSPAGSCGIDPRESPGVCIQAWRLRTMDSPERAAYPEAMPQGFYPLPDTLDCAEILDRLPVALALDGRIQRALHQRPTRSFAGAFRHARTADFSSLVGHRVHRAPTASAAMPRRSPRNRPTACCGKASSPTCTGQGRQPAPHAHRGPAARPPPAACAWLTSPTATTARTCCARPWRRWRPAPSPTP